MSKILEYDTIAAVATPTGEGGIGIIRLHEGTLELYKGGCIRDPLPRRLSCDPEGTGAGPKGGGKACRTRRVYKEGIPEWPHRPYPGRGSHRPDQGQAPGRALRGCRPADWKAIQQAHGGKRQALFRPCPFRGVHRLS